ncbi:hypothetical protein GCM10007907_11690 [Chitinimonas prasina]|uniref:Uncharacterized protein n=1 Tax=Chitinimonas prasina TaxID=1434937 RepID=A0ABQ5YES3_9NEIS|nr:hypothetical protein GCM10007907_11690 [Chitinimonas prasina]
MQVGVSKREVHQGVPLSGCAGGEGIGPGPAASIIESTPFDGLNLKENLYMVPRLFYRQVMRSNTKAFVGEELGLEREWRRNDMLTAPHGPVFVGQS